MTYLNPSTEYIGTLLPNSQMSVMKPSEITQIEVLPLASDYQGIACCIASKAVSPPCVMF